MQLQRGFRRWRQMNFKEYAAIDLRDHRDIATGQRDQPSAQHIPGR